MIAGMALLFACGDGDKVPKGIIPQDEMSKILRDMSLADAYGNDMSVANAPLTDSARQQRVKILARQVLDLHGVSVSGFMKSYQYYEAHADKYQDVMNKVQADITARKNKLPDLMEENAPLQHRLRIIFPYAEKVMLLPKGDTLKPFIKHQQ